MSYLTDIGKLVNEKIVDQVIQQGHSMTGAFEQSLEVVVDQYAVSGLGNTYGIYLNLGVKASEIKFPYARARIEGLTRFVEHRMGASGKEAVSIAYAIATKHAQDGMPTAGSYRFSKTGKRTHMIDIAIEEAEPEMIEIIGRYFTQTIDKQIKVTGR